MKNKHNLVLWTPFIILLAVLAIATLNRPPNASANDASFEELICSLNIESVTILDYPTDNFLFIEGKNIMSLKNFPQLKRLDIRNCDNIENLDILKHLPTLERLEINATKNIDLSPIKNLENLKMLFFSTDILIN